MDQEREREKWFSCRWKCTWERTGQRRELTCVVPWSNCSLALARGIEEQFHPAWGGGGGGGGVEGDMGWDINAGDDKGQFL